MPNKKLGAEPKNKWEPALSIGHGLPAGGHSLSKLKPFLAEAAAGHGIPPRWRWVPLLLLFPSSVRGHRPRQLALIISEGHGLASSEAAGCDIY